MLPWVHGRLGAKYGIIRYMKALATANYDFEKLINDGCVYVDKTEPTHTYLTNAPSLSSASTSAPRSATSTNRFSRARLEAWANKR